MGNSSPRSGPVVCGDIATVGGFRSLHAEASGLVKETVKDGNANDEVCNNESDCSLLISAFYQ